MKPTHILASLILAAISFTLGYQIKGWRQKPVQQPQPVPIERDPGLAGTAKAPPILDRARTIAETPHQPLSQSELESKMQRQFHDSMVDEAAARTEPELRALFGSYGLTEAQIQGILKRRRQLHYEAIEAGELTTKLVKSRADYDAEIRDTLTPEKYLQYREYERTKRAEPAVTRLMELASTAEAPFSETGLASVSGLLAKHSENIRIGEYWHRPYDPLPHPNGGQSGAEEFRREKTIFDSARNNLLSEATDTLTRAELAILNTLLNEQAESIEATIRVFEMSPAEAIKHFEEKAARFRRRSNPKQP